MTSNGPKESASYKIFVGGLDPETTEEDLTEYFSKFGRVVERLIKVDIKTKRSRGFAFIGFKAPEAVDRVLEQDEHRLKGKKIDCKRAMTKEDAYSLNKNLKESCRKVYISNIPRELSKRDLHDIFSMYGKIHDFNLIFKKKETGFLYIIFETEEEALHLIEKKYVEIKGCKLEIQRAIPKETKENPDDDSKGKTIHGYPQNQMPNYRQSFESPYSYGSIYGSANTPVHLGSHTANLAHYSYYDPVGPSHHLAAHLMHEASSPYERPVMVQHSHVMASGDPRYHPTRIYPPTPSYPSNSDPLDRAPHRSRVRSEQAINTIKPQFMNSQTSNIYHPGTEVRPLNPRIRGAGHSFSHVDDHGYQLHSLAYPSSLNETHEKQLAHTQGRELLPSGQPVRQRPAHEFIENKMDFSTFKPKESTQKQDAQGSPRPSKESSPKLEQSASKQRQAKSAKIKSLEEEIKATKEKLKVLEDLLKQEYATVDEGPSHNEGLSHSSNNE